MMTDNRSAAANGREENRPEIPSATVSVYIYLLDDFDSLRKDAEKFQNTHREALQIKVQTACLDRGLDQAVLDAVWSPARNIDICIKYIARDLIDPILSHLSKASGVLDSYPKHTSFVNWSFETLRSGLRTLYNSYLR